MKPSGIQEIAVVVPTKETSQLFFASITEMMVNGYVTHHHRNFNISMRERGKEILQGEDDIAEGMKASDKARNFSFLNLDAIPDELELVLRESKQYCGTVHFYSIPPNIDLKKYQNIVDTVVVIIDKKTPSKFYPYAEYLISNSDSGVCLITVCENSGQSQESAEYWIRNQAESLYSLASRRMHSFHWYHPYGFQEDGMPNSFSNASPYGIEEIFWSIMQISATMRMNYLQRMTEEQRNIIVKRNSIFQRHSLRRKLELNHARGIYSMAVQSMYGVEQLLFSAEGKPLAEDASKE